MSIPPPPRRRPWAPVLAAVGAGLLVVAVALGVWVGRGFSEMVPAPSDIKTVAGDTVVTIDDGETLILYAPRRMMPTCERCWESWRSVGSGWWRSSSSWSSGR